MNRALMFLIGILLIACSLGLSFTGCRSAPVAKNGDLKVSNCIKIEDNEYFDAFKLKVDTVDYIVVSDSRGIAVIKHVGSNSPDTSDKPKIIIK